MKNNKTIAALTETAKSVTFPKYDEALLGFAARLRALVVENFGQPARDMTYDDYSQKYFWEVSDTIATLNGAVVSVKRIFELDPRQPLDAEFARLKDEHKAYASNRRAVAKAVVAMGGEI